MKGSMFTIICQVISFFFFANLKYVNHHWLFTKRLLKSCILNSRSCSFLDSLPRNEAHVSFYLSAHRWSNLCFWYLLNIDTYRFFEKKNNQIFIFSMLLAKEKICLSEDKMYNVTEHQCKKYCSFRYSEFEGSCDDKICQCTPIDYLLI